MRIILDHDTGVVLPPREGEGGPARPREYIETRIESRTGCNQDLISTASIKARNCGLGPHADQTDDMVRI